MKTIPKSIIISRTDSIGDVVLTLPVATVLKEYFPEMKIGFMGKSYTQPVIETCKSVDQFIDVNDFMDGTVTISGEKPEAILHVLPVAAIAMQAKKLKIPLRIGTTNRIYHWITCNKLVKLSRKNSELHEAQLNLKLLEPFGIARHFSLAEAGQSFAMENIQPLSEKFAAFIQKDKYNLILHPKSQGNAREWGVENFIQLIQSLDKDKYNIFISGTQKESELLLPLFNKAGNAVTNITGRMDLNQFISFINRCDGIVANSTGPLHIAAALGKDALGIYPPMRPIHPGRWAPLGNKAQVFVLQKDCRKCKNNKNACECILSIEPAVIKNALDKIVLERKFT